MSADLTARFAALLTEHAPKTLGLVVGCSCGWRIGRTMYEDHVAHVAAVLAEAGVGFVVEAETRRLDMERERNHAEVRAERAEAALAVAYDDGYNDAVTMARCYGHTDHWPEESEPRNPYRAAIGGTP